MMRYSKNNRYATNIDEDIQDWGDDIVYRVKVDEVIKAIDESYDNKVLDATSKLLEKAMNDKTRSEIINAGVMLYTDADGSINTKKYKDFMEKDYQRSMWRFARIIDSIEYRLGYFICKIDGKTIYFDTKKNCTIDLYEGEYLFSMDALVRKVDCKTVGAMLKDTYYKNKKEIIYDWYSYIFAEVEDIESVSYIPCSNLFVAEMEDGDIVIYNGELRYVTSGSDVCEEVAPELLEACEGLGISKRDACKVVMATVEQMLSSIIKG